MAAASSWRRWSASLRSARIPPWTRGWSVLTRPSSISGKPVTAATSVTGRPASRSARAVPPVDTSSKPARARPAANAASPVLSETDSSARRGAGTWSSARSRSTRTCRPSGPTASAPASMSATARGSRRCSTARIRAWSRLRVVAGQDRDRLLGHDRAAVERGIDEVDGAAGHGDPVGERIGHGVRAREGRQQRRMGIEDPTAELAEHCRTDDPHVAGQDDDVGPDGVEGRRQGRVVAAGEQRRLDPLLDRPVERETGPIGEDQHDLAAKLAPPGGRGQSAQVGAGARDADGDPSGHRPPPTSATRPRPPSGAST